MNKILEFLNDPPKSKVLVIGDIMLDKYYFGDVERISPEAPVPVVHIRKIESRIGGAGNTALNLKNLGIEVDILGIVGNDENGNELLNLLKEKNFHLNYIIKIDNITTTKIRVISRNQHLLRIDFEEVKALNREIENKVINIIEEIVKNYDLVIVSDYNKGLITEKISQIVINMSKFTIIDPKGRNWNKYKGANIITPNVKELSEGLNISLENEDKILEEAGKIAVKKFNFGSILITRSEKGLSYIDNKTILHVPTKQSEVYDVSGAGDTVVAALAFGIICNLNVREILEFANLCASIVIKHLGTYAIRKEDLYFYNS
ncbi:MAG: PfkB family carbohydrate kinase [candidate division WOR-3 bacterium]|jgi:D-beta-D-heptose 7-phosphate kinase/D-beta-D-heptose 1-phosphate adenosyltransferase